MRLRHLVNCGILVNKARFHPRTQINDALIEFGVNNDFGLVNKTDDVQTWPYAAEAVQLAG